MGLTMESTGRQVRSGELLPGRERPEDRLLALAGNPNVGKSTVFNALTGLRQHTGNWPGKTVTGAQGRRKGVHGEEIIVDLPGTYSLFAHSAEEAVARDFICFGGADCVIVVCDATCLERSLNLALQVLEITPRAAVCVNLMDEARKKGIHIDLKRLEELLGVPVAGVSARSGKGLDALMRRVEEERQNHPAAVQYPRAVEEAAARVEEAAGPKLGGRLPSRWTALRLLDGEETLLTGLQEFLGEDLRQDPGIRDALEAAWEGLGQAGITREKLEDQITAGLVLTAEGICCETVCIRGGACDARDRKLDRFLLSRWAGVPVMLLGLGVVFWLTILGANGPSQVLSGALFSLQEPLRAGLLFLHAPGWLCSLAVDGVYRTLAWVVSVMLPPMAIFFPLFTLLEDFGYLPRVAFQLDHSFRRAGACGKQALTMFQWQSMQSLMLSI